MADQNKFINKLKSRWEIKTGIQVVMILIVFACTGFSVLFVEKQILDWVQIDKTSSWQAAVMIFILLTLPLYNALLLMYGFVFGQFKFFWRFEKNFFRRIYKLFKHKN